MRSIVKKTAIALAVCFGTLLLSFETETQTQENQNPNSMEKADENVETLQLRVEGMSCQAGCANGIDQMLGQQDGIVVSKTTFNSGTSEIQYDKSRISENEVMSLIEKKGFKTKKRKEDE
jgi:copper chaperone